MIAEIDTSPANVGPATVGADDSECTNESVQPGYDSRGRSKSFREALVWQKAHALTLAVYRCTEHFPRHELFALTSQLRRAAASVPSNFAEGFRKRTTPDKLRFYNIAQGSADECLYHLILAHDLGYADTLPLQTDVDEVSRLLQAYINGLSRHGI